MKFKELARAYVDHHALVAKRSWRKDLSYINRLMIPVFGHRSIRDIRRMEVVAWHHQVTIDNGPYAANRAQEVMRKMFNCAIDWELFDKRNPATRIKRNKEKSRTNFVSPDALPRLLEALPKAKNRYIRAAIWTILLTGLRPGEALRLRWEDINLADGVLKVRDTKNGSDHQLPISAPLLELLETLPPKGEWVFPGNSPDKPLSNIHKAWDEIRVAAKLPELRLHDLRRTVGSYLAIGNYSERIIGQVLNHDDPVSTRVYAKLTLDPLREALDYVGQIVARNEASRRKPKSRRSAAGAQQRERSPRQVGAA